MTATAESLQARAFGFKSSNLRRTIHLLSPAERLIIGPDGGIRALESFKEKRALFGFEQLWFYKVQAGIVVPAQAPDWTVKLTPRQALLTGRVFETDVSQSIELFSGQSSGYLRRVEIRNAGQNQVRIRVIGLIDPTAAHFNPRGRWGSLGVNAFNRETHVAMDEVSDPPSARVVGASPGPSKFYMTTSWTRAQERVSSGELPEATEGMSGQVLIVSLHEMDLARGESREFVFASIYNPGKLEEALSDFGQVQTGVGPSSAEGPEVSCSDLSVTEAATWALSAIEGGAYADDLLDRFEVLRSLTYFSREQATRVVAEAKGLLRRDGSLPHSLDLSRPGVLETAVFLKALTANLSLLRDKKPVKSSYQLVKKLAAYLMTSSKEAVVQTDQALPQGWRRLLGRGYPTGEIPEVSLAVAGALEGASQVSRIVSKPEDAGKFLERSTLICDHVRKKLVDDRGFLSLCRDSGGRLRGDETADMAVAAYRHQFMASAEQAAAHRLLERDFDTTYGPRCVPNSNHVYFNGAYGSGQLGGVWLRAVLAHALLCYRVGLAGMGSISMAKVARLVVEDWSKVGGSPGEFPRWVDVDSREIRDDEYDPVAAARFLEVLIEGELGFSEAAEKGFVDPVSSSTLNWLLASDFWAGEPATVFVGRGGGGVHVFYSGSKLDSKAGVKFAKSERLESSQRGVKGISFHTPGQVICLGNASTSPSRFVVNFPARAAELSRHLSSALEEYDASKGSWTKTGSVRVSTTMSFEASLEPNGWRAYRVATS